jgi:hypothetical protein
MATTRKISLKKNWTRCLGIGLTVSTNERP